MTSDPGRAFLYSQEPSSGPQRTQSRQLTHQPAASSLIQQGTPEGGRRRSFSETPSQRGSTDSHIVAPAARYTFSSDCAEFHLLHGCCCMHAWSVCLN